jgi:hypothetical protein
MNTDFMSLFTNRKYIQFNPGGSSHHPDPYWKISSGQTGTIRINQQLAKDVWTNLGFK